MLDFFFNSISKQRTKVFFFGGRGVGGEGRDKDRILEGNKNKLRI